MPWGIDLDKCMTRYKQNVEQMSTMPSLPLIGSESSVLDTLAIKPEVILTSGGRVTSQYLSNARPAVTVVLITH